MSRRRNFTSCAITALGLVTGATAAAASCDDRPGTPNNVRAEVLSSTSIKFSWQNTTGHWLAEPTMFFDMYIRNSANASIGRDLTGTGPYSVSFGSTSSTIFDHLAPNAKYCFALRARTEGGTQGCISAVTSNWACATTLAAGVSPAPSQPSPPQPPPQGILISAGAGLNNTIVIKGSGFLHAAPVSVRVVDQTAKWVLITTIAGQRITSDGNGLINLRFQGLCTQRGDLFFSAEDGRKVPSNVDHTGTLWSNTAKFTCT